MLKEIVNLKLMEKLMELPSCDSKDPRSLNPKVFTSDFRAFTQSKEVLLKYFVNYANEFTGKF